MRRSSAMILGCALVMLGAWVGCGGVNRSDDQRGPVRGTGSHDDGADDPDDGGTLDAQPAADPDPDPDPDPDDAGTTVDAAPPIPDGSFAVGTQLETTADLNLRDGPGTEFDILTTMPSGSIVKVVKISGADGWVNVDYQATVGYASKSFLQPAP